MHLYLIRHTNVDVTKGLCYGQTNVGLASTFPSEFETIGKKLASIPLHKIYSSPLSRCKMLSEYLSSNCNVKNIKFDDRLKELNFGDWENQKWTDFEQSPTAKYWFNDYINTPTPNGESYKQLMDRTKSFLNELKDYDTSINILAITHAGVVRAVNALIKNITPQNAFNLQVDFGEIIEFDIQA